MLATTKMVRRLERQVIELEAQLQQTASESRRLIHLLDLKTEVLRDQVKLVKQMIPVPIAEEQIPSASDQPGPV